jgi:threonine 3-dehydrogenase
MSTLHPPRSATSRAALFLAAGQPLELRELDVPRPEAGEALIRIECCTICGSDLHTLSGAREEPTPSILGHEILGVVEEVGDPPPSDLDGHPLQPGDRVTWAVFVACGECDRCRQGWPQKCRSLAKYGHALAEGREALCGGLAERLLLRAGSSVVRLDSEIPDTVICPVSCATATVAAACRVGGPLAEQRILILGAGMLGLTAAAFAKSNGAARVAVCDVDPGRLRRAADFGADHAVPWQPDFEELQRGIRSVAEFDAFDLVLELSGAPEAVEAACRLGDVGGRIVLVGSVKKSRPAEIDPERVVRQWLSIRGVHNYAPEDLRAGVEFLTRCGPRFPFEELVPRAFSLSDVNQAIEFAQRERPVRVAIRP